ncbi:hypothetical protein ABIA25_001296 [Sinorhizobium fredii]
MTDEHMLSGRTPPKPADEARAAGACRRHAGL